MPDQIPPGCVALKTHLNSLNTQLVQLQQALADADPADKEQARNAVGKKQQEVNIAKIAYNNCLANPPADPNPDDPHIPGVPDPCVQLYKDLSALNFHLAALKESLNNGGEGNLERIKFEIGQTSEQIKIKKHFFDNCVIENTGPFFGIPPKATKPNINHDTTLTEVTKIISWSMVQKKMDELINHRTDPAIVTVRLHNHPYVPPPGVPNTPQPATDLTISTIEAKVVSGQVTTDYTTAFYKDFGQLSLDLFVTNLGLFINNLNVSAINIAIDGSQPEPISVKVSFDCSGDEEIQFNSPVVPNVDLEELDVSIKLSVDVLRTPKPIPAECSSIQAQIDDMKITMAELQLEIKNPHTNHAVLAKQINKLSVQIIAKQKELTTCIFTHGGADPTGVGRLELLSWIDKIKDLQDDDLDNALKSYISVHLTSSLPAGDGTIQKYARSLIFDALNGFTDKVNQITFRETLSNAVSNWLLGGDGSYDVVSVENSDGQNAVIKYLVPANKLDPFPDSMFRPSDWPFIGNSNPTVTLPVTNSLANIKHIVVLTMENRSFDHMLGYLSLPVSAGGMGRTDVDGLAGPDVNFNPINNVNYPIFPIAEGDTAFDIDPYHSYEPVANQINAELNETDPNHTFFKPGTGKMNGFVKNFFDKAFAQKAPNIMGYHTAVNVPIYDALARDFAISDRWFSAHPGPTFCNRFYEITGRLNLTSGLPLGVFGNDADVWEFSNSSPLTPVFNKTIFDYLTDYHRTIEKGVTWKYYEHAYTFLRFFSKYTFDGTNIVRIDDPVNGFFADAKNGTLPSVSYIDPQFIELPPDANCDGPVADIKLGQDLVQKVVEAVVASPQFANTLLIITYDEHGGFYDHVPPPAATPFDDDFPIKTYGVRVPAFFISPWVKAGSVIGRDANGTENHHFDHTSILKTIAARMMGKNPPYMGPRFAAAQNLSVVLDTKLRKPMFLPFIRYNIMFNASGMMLNVPNGSTATGASLLQFTKNQKSDPAQDFSFELATGGWTYIRTHCGALYVTVDANNFSIKQDVKYPARQAAIDMKCQLWKLSPPATIGSAENSYVIINDLFPNKILQPVSLQSGAQLVLVDKPATITAANTWIVTSPMLS